MIGKIVYFLLILLVVQSSFQNKKKGSGGGGLSTDYDNIFIFTHLVNLGPMDRSEIRDIGIRYYISDLLKAPNDPNAPAYARRFMTGQDWFKLLPAAHEQIKEHQHSE